MDKALFKGYVIVNGRKARILGNICMDQSIIDVTDINSVSMGDEVTLLSSGNNHIYNSEKMSLDCLTIPYEILCSISKRVTKKYCGENDQWISMGNSKDV